MAAAAGLSPWLTPQAPRRENCFTAHPRVEVAVLLVGIFLTMIPALGTARAARVGSRGGHACASLRPVRLLSTLRP